MIARLAIAPEHDPFSPEMFFRKAATSFRLPRTAAEQGASPLNAGAKVERVPALSASSTSCRCWGR